MGMGTFCSLLLFFGIYRWRGLFWATGFILAWTLGQLAWAGVQKRKTKPWQLAINIIVIVLAAASLVLRNAWLIKFKPSAVYILLAVSFLGSDRWWHYPSPAALMLQEWANNQQTANHNKKTAIPVAGSIYNSQLINRLNLWWGCGLIMMSLANALVALYASTDTWVNFKIFGALTASLGLAAGQMAIIHCYANRSGHIVSSKMSQNKVARSGKIRL